MQQHRTLPFHLVGDYAVAQAINRFPPNYLCWPEERVGGFDDGGKWVCSPRSLLKSGSCVIYSFGSKLNFLFENALLDINPDCQIHVFDPTPSLQKQAGNKKFRKNIFFHSVALTGDSPNPVVIENTEVERKTLDQFVNELGHDHIDILKIDIENSEWNQMIPQKSNSFWRSGKIGQIQIEIHVYDKNIQKFYDLVNQISSLGFSLFHTELNIYNILCWEFAFLNLNYNVGGNSVKSLLSQAPNSSIIDTVHASDINNRNTFFKNAPLNSFPHVFLFLEATYHCRKKHFIGDRSSDAMFMYLCMDHLNKNNFNYGAIYDSDQYTIFLKDEKTITSISSMISAVEYGLKSSFPNAAQKIQYIPKNANFTHSAFEMAKSVDVLKVDVPGIAMLKSGSLRDFLKVCRADIVHFEMILCDIGTDVRKEILRIAYEIEEGGYEIYHKEVTLLYSVNCAVHLSLIKRH